MPKKTVTKIRKPATQVRAQETIETILKAAVYVLIKEGYENASTNRIAKKAGVSIGSLYQYFPSKESIVAVLIERNLQEMMTAFETKMAEVRSHALPDAAREVLRAYISAKMVNPKLQKVFNEQIPRVGKLKRHYEMRHYASSVLKEFILSRKDDLSIRNLELATFVVINGADSIISAALDERPESLENDELLGELTDLLVRYLAGRSVG